MDSQVHIKYSHIGSTGRPLIKKETSKTAFIRYNRGFIFKGGLVRRYFGGESGILFYNQNTAFLA